MSIPEFDCSGVLIKASNIKENSGQFGQKTQKSSQKFKVSEKPVWPINGPNFSAKNHSFFSFVIKQDISRQPFCKW